MIELINFSLIYGLRGEGEGNISEHPAFRGVMESQAKLYDLQCDPSIQDIMTFTSPKTGSQIGTSYLEPKTKEDLEKDV